MRHFDNIILNIPHSSINRWWEGWNMTDTMFEVVKKWTDWHTDILFDDENATSIIFPYSRFYCDVERLIDDPLNNEGRGIIYKEFEGYTKMPLDILAMQLYFEWKNKFKEIISNNPNSIIIDCHSFSNIIEPNVDINIGFNNDVSKPAKEDIEWISKHFESNGYRVGINTPYSNSITPVDGYAYKSIMIEVNKSSYMDEETLSIIPENFLKLKGLLSKMYLYLKQKK